MSMSSFKTYKTAIMGPPSLIRILYLWRDYRTLKHLACRPNSPATDERSLSEFQRSVARLKIGSYSLCSLAHQLAEIESRYQTN